MSVHMGQKKNFPAQQGEEKEEFFETRDRRDTACAADDFLGIRGADLGARSCLLSWPGEGEVSGYTR